MFLDNTTHTAWSCQHLCHDCPCGGTLPFWSHGTCISADEPSGPVFNPKRKMPEVEHLCSIHTPFSYGQPIYLVPHMVRKLNRNLLMGTLLDNKWNMSCFNMLKVFVCITHAANCSSKTITQISFKSFFSKRFSLAFVMLRINSVYWCS